MRLARQEKEIFEVSFNIRNRARAGPSLAVLSIKKLSGSRTIGAKIFRDWFVCAPEA